VAELLLLDADALSKLAHWDLLGELDELFGSADANTATLSTLVHRAYRACTKPDGRLFRDTEAARRAYERASKMAPFPATDEPTLLEFQKLAGIDPGEALLLAALVANPSAILLTGDKRAVMALTKMEPEARERLSGRIVQLEQVVLALLKKRGIEWLRARVCPSRAIDKSIAIVFGSDCKASELEVEAGLRSYIANARSASAGLLSSGPPFD
jgi:hypothetical protein